MTLREVLEELGLMAPGKHFFVNIDGLDADANAAACHIYKTTKTIKFETYPKWRQVTQYHLGAFCSVFGDWDFRDRDEWLELEVVKMDARISSEKPISWTLTVKDND